MIKTAIATTAALALMSGIALAQVKTDGGAVKSNTSPTSASSGSSLSTGQTQPMPAGSYSSSTTVGQNSVNGSTTGGPTPPGGAADTGQSASSVTPTTGSGTTTTTQMATPGSTMPMAPTMTSNMPTGDAPSTYPACTHKGQDRCMQRHKM